MDENNKNKEEKFNLEKIAPKLKFLRKSFRFDRQIDLEKHLGFTSNSIHRIESGKGANPDNLVALLHFFYQNNININWLFDVDNKEELALISNSNVSISTQDNNINNEEIDIAIQLLNKFKINQNKIK